MAVKSEAFSIGALLTAAESVGSTAACLAGIVDYLKTRKQFGKLIGSFQALKHPTVDIYVAMEQSRSLVYHASSEINEGPLSHEAEVACRMAKAKAKTYGASNISVTPKAHIIKIQGAGGDTPDASWIEDLSRSVRAS